MGPNNPPAFVANIWRDDNGQTQNRQGLCKERRGGGADRDRDDDKGDDHGQVKSLSGNSSTPSSGAAIVGGADASVRHRPTSPVE